MLTASGYLLKGCENLAINQINQFHEKKIRKVCFLTNNLEDKRFKTVVIEIFKTIIPLHKWNNASIEL